MSLARALREIEEDLERAADSIDGVVAAHDTDQPSIESAYKVIQGAQIQLLRLVQNIREDESAKAQE